MKYIHKLKRVKTLISRYSFSKSHLAVFVLVFAAIGYLIFRSFAATTTKTWDNQADFNTGSLSSTTATPDGHVTLTPTTVGGGGGTAGAGVSVPGYHMTLPPGGSEPSNGGAGSQWAHWFGTDNGDVSIGQEFYAFYSFQFDSTTSWPVNNFDPGFNLHVTT